MYVCMYIVFDISIEYLLFKLYCKQVPSTNSWNLIQLLTEAPRMLCAGSIVCVCIYIYIHM